MNSSKKVLGAVFILALAMIACGTQSDVIVNPPDSAEKEEEIVKSQEEVETQPEESTAATATATKAVGTARSNPAPVGSEVIADDMSFVVLSTIRPATEIIEMAYVYNEDPESDEEYILVEMQITCLKSSDATCTFNPLINAKVIGSLGVEYDMKWVVVGVEDLLDYTEFYGGATLTGSLPFIISQEETDLILVYEPLFGSRFYLEIP
jgi:hypothetical protein